VPAVSMRASSALGTNGTAISAKHLIMDAEDPSVVIAGVFVA
jgi:hypothetical protein